jgi:hypothetical protein
VRRGQILRIGFSFPMAGAVAFSAYNMAGERVLSQSLDPATEGLATESLAPGIYFALLELPFGKLQLKFVVLAP